MDKIYDKLLFGVALLLVAASLAFYFMTAGGLPSGEPESSLTPTGPDYQVVPAPATQTVNASWPEPDPRGQYPERKEKEPWLYEVFTPPKIYIDRKTGEFTPRGQTYVLPPPMRIELAELNRNTYRIQLEGYVEEDPNDPSKSLVLFVNQEDDNKAIRTRVGASHPEAGFEFVSFDIKREAVTDATGSTTIEVTGIATIRDTRTGEQITLFDDSIRYVEGFTAVIRNVETGEVVAELTEVGQRFDGPNWSYILKEINLEEYSVTVEKLPTEDFPDEGSVETLQLVEEEPPQTTPQPNPANNAPTEEPENGGGNADLESLFDF